MTSVRERAERLLGEAKYRRLPTADEALAKLTDAEKKLLETLGRRSAMSVQNPATFSVREAEAKQMQAVRSLVKKGILNAEVSVWLTDHGYDVSEKF